MSVCEPKYDIKFSDRGGNFFYATLKSVDELVWRRRLDATSIADISIVITDDTCCEELGKLEPFAHMVSIYEDESLVWHGWVLEVEYHRNEVNIQAFDLIGWLKRRLIHKDHTWSNEDLSDIFVDIWEDAMEPSPVLGELVVTQTNVRENREVKKSENRTAWNAVREMLDTGLDITAFGKKIIVGIVHTTTPIELSMADFSGDVSVKKAGSEYGNSITVDASASAVATYPPSDNPSGNQFYPLVEEIVRDAQIQDAASALNAAKARYEYNRYVPRIITNTESLTLNPNSNITINQLIPGIRIFVDTTGLCYATKQEFRLGGIDVSISEGRRSISFSLQPVGPVDSLASAEDPIA